MIRTRIFCFAVLLTACGTSPDESGTDPSSGGSGHGGSGGASGGSSSGGAGGNANAGSGTGGTATGGSTTTGGSGGSATGGSGAGGSAAGGTDGSGGSVVIPPPECEEGSTALPEDAPNLVPGVWTNVSPSGGGLSFGGGANLTQGMTIVPCGPATLYAAICAGGGSAAYPKGVYRSTNAGTSWTRILEDDSPNHIRVDPTNPLNLYVTDGVAGGTAGFYRTTDGGVTWTHKTNMCDSVGISNSCGMNDLYDVAVDPTDFQHLLISFHSPWQWGANEDSAGVLESTDGGDTWIPHGLSYHWGKGHSIHFLYRPDLGIGNANTWLLGIQDGGGRWRTTDAGETWTKVSEIGIQHGGSSVYYTPDGVLYSASNPGVVKSTDNGATWTALGNAPASVGIIGDGENLYGTFHGGGPMRTALISDDNNWSDYPGTPNLDSGSFEFAFDAANGIVYDASIGAGVLALKLE